MRIVPPDFKSTRSRLADWLELNALTSESKQVSVNAFRSVHRIELDDRAQATDLDPSGDDSGEPEITDRFGDDVEERVVDELEFRQKTIGTAYPFELVGGQGLKPILLRCKENWDQPEEGLLFYVFCLLDSCIREKVISVPEIERPLVQQIGNVFQICACVAVGGHLGFEVVSFGFPRATGTSFLPALKQAWQRYGSFTVKEVIPFGFDARLQDGGIDIIAWRHFDDGFAATMLMFVQVASGLDWKDKPVANDVKTIKKWFDGACFEHFVPAICIPFPLWFDLAEPVEDARGNVQDFYTGVRTRFLYREGTFGVIFDRGRIARAAGEAVKRLPNVVPQIDGIDLITDVKTWVAAVAESLKERRAAA